MNSKLLALAIMAAALALAVAVGGCGDRPPAWSEPASLDQTFGLTGGVAIVDAPADRVVLLIPGAGQSLRIEPVAVGRHILTVMPSPQGNKLFVLSAGHRAKIGDNEADEKPSLSVIEPGAAALVRRYELAALTDPLAGLAVDPIEERWAVMYAATGPNQAFVQNPNELVFLDLTQPPESATLTEHTLHSFGGRPVRLTFTPTLALPAGARRLLIVESNQDLSILDLAADLGDPRNEITVPLTSGGDNRQLTPAAVTVDDGDPARDDDARIGVRLKNDPSVVTLTLGPDPGATGFRPTVNLTDVGGVPSDIAFVRTDGGLRLAALVPTRSAAVLVDPVTSLTTEIALPARYQSLSLVTDVAGGGPGAAVDVALLWNGGTAATDGVAFWELGQTAGQPYRSIETVGVAAAIADVLPVPRQPTLRVLRTASASEFYVLDLQTRTAAPLVTSTAAIALSMSPIGDRVWTFTPGGTSVAATGIMDTHPRSLLIERPVRQVFEVDGADGSFAMILHGGGGGGVTIYDAASLDDDTRRLYSSVLTGGPY
jgi:hypothetical protein